MIKQINTPLNKETIQGLKAGDRVKISGTVYTARDAAHKKFTENIKQGEKLPFDIKGQIIYYVGPCPAKPGDIIGSAGPTTSGRMDDYTPRLIRHGLSGMIGKGGRSNSVINAMIEYGAVYFGATGGAAALIAKAVKSHEIIAYRELGTEAVRKLKVIDFPAVVIIDSYGNNLYESGRKEFEIMNYG